MAVRNLVERIKRVLLVSNKPDMIEYKQAVKITGIGFVIIGIIGFVIFLIGHLIGGL